MITSESMKGGLNDCQHQQVIESSFDNSLTTTGNPEHQHNKKPSDLHMMCFWCPGLDWEHPWTLSWPLHSLCEHSSLDPPHTCYQSAASTSWCMMSLSAGMTTSATHTAAVEVWCQQGAEPSLTTSLTSLYAVCFCACRWFQHATLTRSMLSGLQYTIQIHDRQWQVLTVLHTIHYVYRMSWWYQ